MLRTRKPAPLTMEALLKQVSTIPKGQVTTYKLLSESLGLNCYRAVGSMLGKNPTLIKIPCHRVVLSSGLTGSYATGSNKKIALLRSEGIKIVDQQIQNFEQILFKPKQVKS